MLSPFRPPTFGDCTGTQASVLFRQGLTTFQKHTKKLLFFAFRPSKTFLFRTPTPCRPRLVRQRSPWIHRPVTSNFDMEDLSVRLYLGLHRLRQHKTLPRRQQGGTGTRRAQKLSILASLLDQRTVPLPASTPFAPRRRRGVVAGFTLRPAICACGPAARLVAVGRWLHAAPVCVLRDTAGWVQT